jgi:PadR family transcriptional regulator, regulatory protein PadR
MLRHRVSTPGGDRYSSRSAARHISFGGAIMNREELLPGTLHLLILKTLARNQQMHGFEIARSIQQMSQDVLQVEEGSLYPALQRMLIKGWVKAEWGVTAENRRARYYRLTAGGRKQLEVEKAQFDRVIAAIARVIQTA